ERRDVLDAIQTSLNQLARVDDLEVSGAWNGSRTAHINHFPGTCKGQAKIDFQRRSTLLHVALGEAPGFLRVAGHDRIVWICRMFTIDVRAGRKDARSRQMIVG